MTKTLVWFVNKTQNSCNLFANAFSVKFWGQPGKIKFQISMHALAMLIDLEKKSCWQYKSDLFYVTLFCGSIGLRSMSEPISASFSLALNWDKKNNSFLVNPVGLTLRYFEARMTWLKPLQNKKGQKNLGYPRNKQSFYKKNDCFFLSIPNFFGPSYFEAALG
mgnify:CR=1 FL=1